MNESYDSGKDLFITQSSFRSAVDTQEASEAVDFLNTSLFDLSEDVPLSGEVVEYWDFMHEHEQELKAILEQIASESSVVKATSETGNNPFSSPQEDVSAQAIDLNVDVNLLNKDVDKVSDDTLNAAVDEVTKVPTLNRHADPVSDKTIKENSGKGYVCVQTFRAIVNELNPSKYGL